MRNNPSELTEPLLHSALVIALAQAANTAADSVAETESSEQPVVRVTTVVVHGSAVATVVVTGFAGVVGVGSALCGVGLLDGRRGSRGGHLGGALRATGNADASHFVAFEDVGAL